MAVGYLSESGGKTLEPGERVPAGQRAARPRPVVARVLAIAAIVSLVAAACSSNNGSQNVQGASSGPFNASSVSGNITLAGWSAAGSTELNALQKVLDQFEAKYPKIKVKFQPIAGDYPSAMVAKFSAHQAPDLFYVDSSVAPDWINQGVLMSLDNWIKSRNFDTSQFYSSFLDAFKGPDGQQYGIPKDGNALGLAYNPAMLSKAGVSSPPTTYDELTADAQKLKAAGEIPMCLSTTLDRSLAFIYGEGGSIFSSDKKSATITDPKSVKGIDYYLSLFKQGFGQSPSQLGDSWCGDALGKQQVAMIFEGGWLDASMKSTYPSVQYKWAPMPKGAQQATLAFTVSYSIGKDSPNKDAAWVLLTYLTSQQGMQQWVKGGVALPSRKDVTAQSIDQVLVQAASYAHPWSFVPGFSKVQTTYDNALTAAIQGNGTGSEVASKTQSAAQAALSSH